MESVPQTGGDPSPVRTVNWLHHFFYPPPFPPSGERIVWTKWCNWVAKDGNWTKAGCLFITDHGTVIWKSALWDVPWTTWTARPDDILSIEAVPGNPKRKAQKPFGANLRMTCNLVLKDGTNRIIFPAELGERIQMARHRTGETELPRQ